MAFLHQRFRRTKCNFVLYNHKMNTRDFNTTITVMQPAEHVFNAINNVAAWWSENIVGDTATLHSEFIYCYKDVHVCKLKIVELVPNKRVVWLVVENEFNFTSNKSEWKGNRLIFDIKSNGKETQIHFTQQGLVPEYECYNVCRDAWTSYIHGSLKNLIVSGKGNPNTKENDLNNELIQKWGLPVK